MIKRKVFRLPTEQYSETEDANEYVDAWYDLAKPIRDSCGLEVGGLDPYIRFFDEQKRSVTLPLWFVKRINRALERKRS